MFRFRKHKPLVIPIEPIQIDVSISQFDDDGVEHVSFAKVSAQSIIDKLPRPSEMTLVSQMQAGTLNPVSLDDFEVSNLDVSKASSIINTLNVD